MLRKQSDPGLSASMWDGSTNSHQADGQVRDGKKRELLDGLILRNGYLVLFQTDSTVPQRQESGELPAWR